MNAWLLCLAVLGPACDPPSDPHDATPATGARTLDALVGQDAPPARGDAWFAEDKLRHLGMSFAATAFAYAAARPALDPDAALVLAGTTALLAGIGKEVHDARAGRWFSLKDLAWNAAGVALGLTLAHHTR